MRELRPQIHRFPRFPNFPSRISPLPLPLSQYPTFRWFRNVGYLVLVKNWISPKGIWETPASAHLAEPADLHMEALRPTSGNFPRFSPLPPPPFPHAPPIRQYPTFRRFRNVGRCLAAPMYGEVDGEVAKMGRCGPHGTWRNHTERRNERTTTSNPSNFPRYSRFRVLHFLISHPPPPHSALPSVSVVSKRHVRIGRRDV